jgi:hypothetical protein
MEGGRANTIPHCLLLRRVGRDTCGLSVLALLMGQLSMDGLHSERAALLHPYSHGMPFVLCCIVSSARPFPAPRMPALNAHDLYAELCYFPDLRKTKTIFKHLTM